MHLMTDLLLRIIQKKLEQKKKQVSLLYLSVCLKESFNTEVKDIDIGLVEENGYTPSFADHVTPYKCY